MQEFIKLMKSDKHDKSNYVNYMKDIKFLVDSHVPQLVAWEPKDIAKMVMTTIQDPECKYLCPSESTEASSSDEGMPQNFDVPSEGDIMAEFPKDILTNEVRMAILSVLEHMETSHMEAAEAMRTMKKLITKVPVGPFCLLLQGTRQPCIMIQHQWHFWVWSVKPKEQHCGTTLLDIIPDGQLAQNLLGPLRTLAAILHYQVKNKTGIKVSILATLKVFGTQEKLLHQALTWVHYESGMQKQRWEDASCDQEEESSSSVEEDDNYDDDEEGAFARIKLLSWKKHKKWDHWKKWKQWHWSHLIITVFPPGPLHPPFPH